MTEQVLAEAFGLRALVQPHPVTGTPMVVPIAPLDSTERESVA
jgi:iron complex transport system ATP-binding protein